jgi:hypothetical protein
MKKPNKHYIYYGTCYCDCIHTTLKVHNKHGNESAQQAQLWRCKTSMIKNAWRACLKATPPMPSKDIHKVKKYSINISSVVIKRVRVKQKWKNTLHLNNEWR